MVPENDGTFYRRTIRLMSARKKAAEKARKRAFSPRTHKSLRSFPQAFACPGYAAGCEERNTAAPPPFSVPDLFTGVIIILVFRHDAGQTEQEDQEEDRTARSHEIDRLEVADGETVEIP